MRKKKRRQAPVRMPGVEEWLRSRSDQEREDYMALAAAGAVVRIGKTAQAAILARNRERADAAGIPNEAPPPERTIAFWERARGFLLGTVPKRFRVPGGVFQVDEMLAAARREVRSNG